METIPGGYLGLEKSRDFGVGQSRKATVPVVKQAVVLVSNVDVMTLLLKHILPDPTKPKG